MTTKQKAKAYNKLFIKAKQIYNKENDVLITHTIEDLFPELKESEDEKIRKELLEHCINRRDGKQVCVDASDYRRWADWLFRQAVENIPILPYVKSDKEISNEIIEFLKLPHPQFVGKRHQEEWIAWLEKQVEQRPQGKTALEAIKEEKVDNANKVESMDCRSIKPKFKVEDWITDGYVGGQITSIENNYPCYKIADFMGGISSSIPFTVQDEFHLWTIKDAKDGDVLVDVYGNIGIYEKCYDFDWVSYCSLGHNGGFQHFKIEHENEKTYPATKEQREQLEKAMADAGWEFDFEKKELKKISQRMISAEAKEAMYDKPWSEEDKDFMYDTLSNLTELKDRYGEGYGNVGKCIDWLKSLSPQNRWKPSDEQLEAVRIAAEVGTANNSWAMDILKCIYQYLKKLREE